MHISEGVLSAPVLAVGYGLTVAGTAVGLYTLDEKNIPKTGLMAAVFFIASFIHVPVGPSSVHLVLNGLAGVLLGWAVFPALLVALFLQAILFQFGGLSTLGVNTFCMAFPAVLCGLFFRAFLKTRGQSLSVPAAALGGAIALGWLAMAGVGVGFSWCDLFNREEDLVIPWRVLAAIGGAGVVVGAIAGPVLRKRLSSLIAFASGSGAVFLSAVFAATALYSTGKGFLAPAELIVGSHVVIMPIEGLLTAFCVAFLLKVKPSVLGFRPAGSGKET